MSDTFAALDDDLFRDFGWIWTQKRMFGSSGRRQDSTYLKNETANNNVVHSGTSTSSSIYLPHNCVVAPFSSTNSTSHNFCDLTSLLIAPFHSFLSIYIPGHPLLRSRVASYLFVERLHSMRSIGVETYEHPTRPPDTTHLHQFLRAAFFSVVRIMIGGLLECCTHLSIHRGWKPITV